LSRKVPGKVERGGESEGPQQRRIREWGRRRELRGETKWCIRSRQLHKMTYGGGCKRTIETGMQLKLSGSGREKMTEQGGFGESVRVSAGRKVLNWKWNGGRKMGHKIHRRIGMVNNVSKGEGVDHAVV